MVLIHNRFVSDKGGGVEVAATVEVVFAAAVVPRTVSVSRRRDCFVADSPPMSRVAGVSGVTPQRFRLVVDVLVVVVSPRAVGDSMRGVLEGGPIPSPAILDCSLVIVVVLVEGAVAAASVATTNAVILESAMGLWEELFVVLGAELIVMFDERRLVGKLPVVPLALPAAVPDNRAAIALARAKASSAEVLAMAALLLIFSQLWNYAGLELPVS